MGQVCGQKAILNPVGRPTPEPRIGLATIMSFPSFSSLISTTATHTSARSEGCRCLEMLPMVSQGFLSWIARKQSLLQLLSFFLCLIASEASNYLSDFLFLEPFPDFGEVQTLP